MAHFFLSAHGTHVSEQSPRQLQKSETLGYQVDQLLIPLVFRCFRLLFIPLFPLFPFISAEKPRLLCLSSIFQMRNSQHVR